MANLKLQTGAGGLPAAPNALALADLLIVGQSGGLATTGVAYRTSFTDAKALLLATNSVPISALVNASAQNVLMARVTAGAGAWEEKTSSADMMATLGAANYAAARALWSLGAAALLGVATDADTRAQTSSTVLLKPANLAGCASFMADKNGTNQAGIADATFTQITFGNEQWDVGGLFASNAWVPPASKVSMGGQLNCSIATSFATGGFGTVSIFKNGVRFVDIAVTQFFAGQTTFLIAAATKLNANGTDSYALYVFANTTAGATYTVSGNVLSTNFNGEQI